MKKPLRDLSTFFKLITVCCTLMIGLVLALIPSLANAQTIGTTDFNDQTTGSQASQAGTAAATIKNWDFTSVVSNGNAGINVIAGGASAGGKAVDLVRSTTGASLTYASFKAHTLTAFKLNSIAFRYTVNTTGTNISPITLTGYKNGVATGSANFAGYVAVNSSAAWNTATVSSNTAFNNIDEVRVTGATGGTNGVLTIVWIDDINISNAITPAVITATGTLDPLTTLYGTASSSTSFNVSGTDMAEGILVTPPLGFEVSLDNAIFSSTVTVGSAGTISSTPVYVRLKANESVNTYSGNIVLSSTNATNVNVATASSSVTNTAPVLSGGPYIVSAIGTSQTSTPVQVSTILAGLTYSDADPGALQGIALNSKVGLGTTTTTGWQYSTDAVTWKSLSASLISANTWVLLTGSTYIRYIATASTETATLSFRAWDRTNGSGGSTNTGTSSATNALSGGSAAFSTGTATLSLSVIQIPTITPTGTLTAVNTTYGTASATPTSFTVAGSNLTNDITVTPPTGFELSTSATGTYSSTLTLTQSGGAYSGTVYVRLAANTVAGTYSGNITLSSTGATDKTVATVSSTVAQAVLTYTANAASRGIGATDPIFSGTVTGYVNGESLATATTGTAVWTTTATNASTDGSYPINGSGLSATNYSFVQAAGNATALTITPGYVVVNTNDTGTGSLRDAITQANASAGTGYTITFNIPGTAPFVISPVTTLPFLNKKVTIDGTSQPGYTSAPLVQVDGGGTLAGGFSLGSNSAGSVIKGLSVTRFTTVGINITTANNTIAGCYVGVKPDGTTAAANAKGIIISSAAGNAIGGPLLDRNVISGNSSNGIEVSGSASTGTKIQHNYIGTNAAGTAIVANAGEGINIASSANTIVIGTDSDGSNDALEGNVISGNTLDGISLTSSTGNNKIAGNYIGTNAAGTAALLNSNHGIYITTGGGTNNVVGGPVAASRNVISGNGWSGIQVATASNTIYNNYIGVSADGTAIIANCSLNINYGNVYLQANSNTVGSTTTGLGNVISGCAGAGVIISGSSNIIIGNYIGTNAAGTAALKNSIYGIIISSGSNNIIGGGTAGAGNVISGNGSAGIPLVSGSGNKIQGNIIGLNAAGTAAIPNAGTAIDIRNTVTTTLIGTDADGTNDAAERNIISGNTGYAITHRTTAANSGTIIAGNYIGTNIDGTAAIANGGGISVSSAVVSGTIGGNTSVSGNLIAGNTSGIGIALDGSNLIVKNNIIGKSGLPNTTGITVRFSGGTPANNTISLNDIGYNTGKGITMKASTGTGNLVSQNTIHHSGTIGIDLNDNGVTANDAGDADTGPNNLLNFPVITAVTHSGGNTIIEGTIDMTATVATYTVELFTSASNGASKYGEGETYLGNATVTTDATGHGTFSKTYTGTLYNISATATDASNNTSEFALSQKVAPTVSTTTASTIASTKATLGGNVTDDGLIDVTDRGVVYGTSANPTIANTKVAIGTGTGTFSQQVTSLNNNTLYHFRGYATNTQGTSYGSDLTFATAPAAPTINTPTSVTTVGFSLTWNAPTGANSYRLDVSTASDFSSFVTGYNNLTVGTATKAVTGLSAGTTYYIRVRAVNNVSSISDNSTTYTQATAAPIPTIAPTGTLAAVNTTYGTASATPTSFTVAASNLTADISVIAPTGFEMSTTSGGTYTSTLTLTQVSGSYSGTVYVRLAANAPVATYTGDITLSSTGATNATIATASSVVSKATLTYTASAASRAVGATDPTFGGTVTGYVNGENQNTATTGTLAWATTATNASTAGNYPINGSGLSATNYTFAQAAGNATALTITAPSTPTISTNGTLIAVNTTYGVASGTPTTFTLTGTNLTSGLIITAPAGYQISVSATSGYNTTLTLFPCGGMPLTSTIYVRLAAATGAGSYSGDIILKSTGATDATIATVSSTVAKAQLTYTANAASRAAGATDPTFSGTVTGFVNGENQNTATTGTLAWASTATSASTAGNYPINGSGLSATNYSFTQAAGNATALTITTPSPAIVTAGTLTDLGTTYGTASATPASFTVTGSNLTADISVTAPNGFEMATTSGGTYTSTLTLTQASGAYSGTVYVRLAANASAGPHSGDITLSSTGATNATVATVSSTVAKATLTYTASTAAHTINTTIPTLSGTVTGYVNGENQNTATTGTIAWTTTAITSSPVGTYPITGSGLSATNYTFAQAAGNSTAFTVNAAATPTINTTGTLAAVNTIYGTASATPTSFVVTGTNLTAGLLITAPAGYQISTSAAGSYNTTLTLFPCGGMPLTSTIYVRLAAATTVGDYSGDITLKSTGATDAAIATASSSVAKAHLTYTADVATRQAGASDPTFSGTVSGFKNGQNQAGATTGTVVWTTTATSGSPAGSYAINGSGLSATNYDFVQAGTNATALTVTAPPTPFIGTTGALAAVGTTYGTASASPTNFSVSGSNLTANITVTAPAGYEMSTTSGGIYSAPLTLTQSSGTFSGTVYVRLAANAVAGAHAGDITLSSTGATDATVATISSTVAKATLTYTANAASRAAGATDPTFSGTITGFVNSENLAGATTGAAVWATTATSASIPGNYPINGSGLSATNYTFTQAVGNAAALTITNAVPALSTSGTLAAVGTTYGTASATPTSFTVSGSNLTADISVSAPAGFEMSTTSGGTYTSTLTLTQSSGSYSGTVYVRLAANASAGSHSGDITLSSTGATNATVTTATSVVNKATLTYTANTASKTYADANPTFGGTVTGFVNGENLGGATTGAASWSSTAITGSDAGSYAITGAGLSATNYTFVQAAGNATAFVINKAVLTYTANTASKIYWGTDPTFSGTVTGFVNGDNLAGATTGTIAWTSNANTASAIGNYRINGSGLSATNYTFGQASSNNTAYTINAATLTYTADATSKTYGDANPTFSGTVTGFLNGETLANVTSGTVTWSSAAITGSAAGSYDITGSGLTARNYNFVQAAGNTTALTVNKASLTYTANTASKTYGDANPTFGGTVTGFVNGDNLAGATTGTAAWASTATTSSAVGSYAIAGSGLSASNYTFAQAAGNTTALTVGKATLTYTANTASKTYGDANPVFGGTITGFVNSDNLAGATTGTAAWLSTATSSSAVGSYPVTGSGLSAANYTFAQAAGNNTALTVGKATLTYTANATSKTYGDANPIFSGTVTGFVNGDNLAGATAGTTVWASTATTSSAVGSYPVTGSGLSSANYTFAQAAGNTAALTIGKATLTYTANAASKTYGDVNPTFSGTVTGFVNSDNLAGATTGTATWASTATTSSAVGSYTVNGSGLSATNYIFVQAAGNSTALTIGKATLTYTANTASKNYGDANPTFSGTVTGFVNSDNLAGATTGTATWASTATTSSVVGSYPVTGSGLSATNYSFTQAAGNTTALTINKASQTITFNALSNKTYGDTDFDPAATSDNAGNAVTYSSSNTAVATIVAGKVHILAAGNTVIKASQAADANHNAATDATQSLTVDPKTLTVTLNATPSVTKFYNGDNSATLAANNYSLNGLVSGDPVTVTGTATYDNPNAGSGKTVTATTFVLAGAKKDNYTLTTTTATVSGSISAYPLTITAAAKNKTYGDTDPSLTYTASAMLFSGDSYTGTLIRDAGENAGSYAIKVGTLTPGNNYSVSYTGANLVIGTKAIAVTAAPKSKTYGDADPVLTYTNTPLVGTDAFTGALTRNAGENVGVYSIKQGTLALSSNYALSYTGADLTIGKKTIAVTASAQNKTYGDVDPSFAYTNPPLVGSDAFTGSLIRDAGENVGTYAIKQGSLALNSNYVLTYTGDNLSIGARAVGVTADLKNKTYGDADPALTYAVSRGNLVNGDTFTGALTRDAGENVGTYAIKQGTLALSSNYILNFASGSTLSIGQKALTITADNKTKVYGSANPALNAIYTGFVSGDDATKLTAQPTLVTAATTSSAAGAYPITASGAASANYAISYVGGTLTVNKAALTITADNKVKVYGSANPALTASYSGFVNGDTNANLTTQPALVTTATASSAVGSYPVTAGGAASGNYVISYVGGTLTVNNATLTITADNKTKTYGGANPALTVTYSGFVNGDTQASLTTPATATTPATTASGAGTYTITPAGAVAPGYTVVYNNGTLTVNKAVLNIAADNKSRNYGVANPALTVTYSGFVNGDTNASLTAQPAIATNAAITSAPGNYAIIASGAASPNYTFTYASGTFTVVPLTNATMANLTISSGILSPVFSGSTFSYETSVIFAVDQITLTPTFDPTATITINGAASGNGTTSAPIALQSGDNIITMVVTAQDGTTKLTYTVKVHRPLPPAAIVPTNVLSPNSDGKNDSWVIKDIQLYPNNTVTIYDRAGREVYSKKGYNNDWDGTLKGAPLAQGTYYYIIDLGPNYEKLKGFITILKVQ